MSAFFVCTLCVSNVSYAGSASAEFGQFYATLLDNLLDSYPGIKDIPCKDSYITSDSDKVSRVSSCTRVDKDTVVTESTPYSFINDRRVVDYKGNAYVVLWSQLKSNTNPAEPMTNEDALVLLFMDDLVKEQSREKTFSAGFANTYAYRHIEFDKIPAKECVILSGRRNRTASVAVLTCSNLEPDMDEIKGFMKLLP